MQVQETTPVETTAVVLTDSDQAEILYVDDETVFHNGVKRMLEAKLDVWNLTFANTGEEALNLLGEGDFDIVISDMRLPGIDGATLLQNVKNDHPDTIRIILSGFSEQSMMLRSVGAAHQHLSKPFSANGLMDTISRTLALKRVLEGESIQRVVSRIETLPSLPDVYEELMAEIEKEFPSKEAIVRIINRDIGMTAKILQVINSAFFGLRRSVTDVGEAVGLLGTDMIKALTLSVGIFSRMKVDKAYRKRLNSLWQHSMEVGLTARAIAQREGSALVEEAFTAGFLHDVGTLVLMLNLPDLFDEVNRLSNDEELYRIDAEKQVYGTTHGAIGAYLLGLWGMPWNMVEAVAFYYNPSKHAYKSFRPLTALHIAHFLCRNKSDSLEEIAKKLDLEYLDQIGAREKIPEWYDLYHNLREEESAKQS